MMAKPRMASLLRYQLAALCVWVYAVQFWVVSLWTVVVLGSEARVLLSTVHGFYKLMSSVSIIVGAHVGLLAVRHVVSVTYTRRRVFSNAIQIYRAIVNAAPFHLLHGSLALFCGHNLLVLWRWPKSKHQGVETSLRSMYTDSDIETYERVVFPLLSVVVCGVAFSFNFMLTHAGCLLFPPVQLKRFTRLRLSFQGVVIRSFVFAFCVVGSLALLLGVSTNVQKFTRFIIHMLLEVSVLDLTPSWTGFLNAVVFCWLNTVLFAIAAQLYEIFMTEAKPISTSTPLPISTEEEVDLLLDSIYLCENGSVSEAMHGFPLPDLASNENPSKATSRAKSSVLLMQAKGEKDMAEINKWWELVVHSLTNQGLAPMWEQFCLLREKRLDAVTQALYACDAKLLGNLFQARKPLTSSVDIVKARALLDLSILTEFSPQRRRNILSRTRRDHTAWIELADVLVSSLDSLTVLLRVSVKMCALEPTLPVDENGVQQAEAYVLGPGPREEKSISEKERTAYAWRVESAVRKWKFRPVFSRGWWQENLFSELYEFNPITLQRQLFEEKSHRMKSQEHAPAWERQWHHQQKLHSRRWLRRFVSFFKRTPLQCTEALFSESQSVTWAIRSLCNIVVTAKKEDQYGVVQPTIPMILASVVDCVIAIEEYKSSPSFLGSTDPLPELEGNKLCRKQVDSVLSECEDALYRLTGFVGGNSRSFLKTHTQRAMLQQFIDCKR